MRVRAIMVLLLAGGLIGGATASAQEPPRIGVGAVAGAVLGSRLMEHGFTATVEGEDRSLVQEVNLRDGLMAAVQGEWYVTRHVALRAQFGIGSGRLTAETYESEPGDTEVEPFQRGFDDVGLAALDAGVSIWPWTPRTVGFAPYVTVGYGMVSYDFPAAADDAFFRADGTRRRDALVVGAGADMRIWQSVVLRMEATNHMVESPLDAADFARSQDRRPPAGGLFGERISNVRLLLGAHVYLPFDDNPGIPD